MLVTAASFGALCGFLVDFWLGRLGFTKEPVRVIIAAAVGVVVGLLVYFGHQAAF